MAIMWPRKIPSEIQSNLLRRAECKVFRKLKESLDDHFVVFYSRPWLGLKSNGEEIDGECDFVIAHHRYGVLFLEVKGGSIAYDPTKNIWTSQDKYGFVHHIKDPVNQARSSKYQLIEKIKKSTLWTPRYIRAAHGVIFPDCDQVHENLGADKPLALFCFSEEFEDNLEKWILKRMGDNTVQHTGNVHFGQDGINVLVEILAHPFQLHVSMGRILDDDDCQINILTQQQFHILAAIEGVKRAAISGGAGTGKTILAAEEARRRAESGMRTLFICFNKPLSIEISRRLKKVNNLKICTFHDMCLSFILDANLSIPTECSEQILFNEILPQLMIKALDIQPSPRFDAIIIDEGQDFLPIWLCAIDSCLDKQGSGLLRIFYDSNQKVYRVNSNLPEDIKVIPIRLTRNLRNTKRIHDLISKFYSGYTIESIGPYGTEVEWHLAASIKEIRSIINDRINDIVSNESVNPSNIAILTSNKQYISDFNLGTKIADIPSMSCEEHFEGHITVDTVRRFKGLESKIVFIVLTKELIRETELIYVALSRARTHLIIVGLAEYIEFIQG